jgi:hypothetical protein
MSPMQHTFAAADSHAAQEPSHLQIGACNFFMALKALQAMECAGLITKQQRTAAELEVDLSQTDNLKFQFVLQFDHDGARNSEDHLHLGYLRSAR